MAVFNGKLPTNLTEYPNSFKRQGSFPLEAFSVFYDIINEETKIVTTTAFAAAENYAKTNPIAYVGQILAVVKEEEGVKYVETYVIDNENGDLKEVGSAPIGDEKTITVDENGVVSMFGASDVTTFEETDKDGNTVKIRYQPVLADGELTWVRLSSTTVEGLASQLEILDQKFNNYYTKEETAELIGEAGHLKREIVETLPTTEIDLNTVYMVKRADSEVVDGETIQDVYDEYLYINNEWELIGNTIVDLSNYYTKSEANEQFAPAAAIPGIITDLKTYVKHSQLNTEEFEVIGSDENSSIVEKVNIKEIDASKVVINTEDEEGNESRELVNEAIARIDVDIDNIQTNINNVNKFAAFGSDFDTNEFTVGTDNEGNVSGISIKAVDASKITGLEENYVTYDNFDTAQFIIEDAELEDSEGNPIVKQNQISIHSIDMDIVDGLQNALNAKLNGQVFTDYHDNTIKPIQENKLDKSVFNEYVEQHAEHCNKHDEDLQNLQEAFEAHVQEFVEFSGTTIPGLLNDKLDKEVYETFVGQDIIDKEKTLPNLIGENLLADLLNGRTKTVEGVETTTPVTLESELQNKVGFEVFGPEISRIEKKINDNKQAVDNYFDITLPATYVTQTEFDTFVDTEAKANSGIRFINQDEINKLEKLVLSEDGEVGISGTINAANVKELDTTVIDIVTRAPIYQNKIDETTGEPEKDAEGNVIKELVKDGLAVERGAQVNKVEGILLGETNVALEGPAGSKLLKIPTATSSSHGVVRSVDGDKENFVKVHAEQVLADDGRTILARRGEMEVVSLNVDRLTQTEGSWLILNGGNASLTKKN